MDELCNSSKVDLEANFDDETFLYGIGSGAAVDVVVLLPPYNSLVYTKKFSV
jgi:hypothetical protein